MSGNFLKPIFSHNLYNPSGYELTDFGKLYKELWKFDRKTILEILYYKCVRNNKLINILVNDYFKIKYSSYPYKFNIVDIDNFFKDKIKLLNFGNLDNFKEARSFFINSLSEEEGFGRLNLIKKISRQEYEIAKCLPTWKSTFYILGLNELSLKQQNASLIINIDRVLDEKNSLGRIFLLHEEDIDFLLDELVSMNLIKREKVSNFNQIKISENFNSESELIGVLHKYE